MKQLAVLLIFIATAAVSDTLLVPSEYPSIHDAISASQNGDTVLVSPGEYGGPISFQGKNIVVVSTNGAGATLIRTFPWNHCVSFTGGEDTTAVLEGFTIRNRITDGNGLLDQDPVDKGGGIYIYESSPTVRDCIIDDCTAGMGGGIYMNYTSARIISCRISNNELQASPYRGSGIFAGRSWEDIPPLIMDCEICFNTNASYGGGIQVEASFVRIINNYIHDNYSDHESGGINVWGSGPLIQSNYINENEGGSGGGIYIDDGYATIAGNIISNNLAGHGGGIYEDTIYPIYIINNSIICNHADTIDGWGGGLLSWKDSVFISNCVIWNNCGAFGSQISIAGGWLTTFAEIGYSDIQYGSDSIYADSYSILNWGPGNIDSDPLFEAGPICDFHLSMDSPCIDAGNPASEYNDPEDPFNPGYALWPAMGYLRNDMGAFGGGSVGYWLTVEEEEQPSPGEEEPGLICYPNPSNGSVSITIPPAFIANTDILVFDISGKLVRRFTDLETNIIQWDCDDDSGREVPSGVYLVQGISGEQVHTVRFVKL